MARRGFLARPARCVRLSPGSSAAETYVNGILFCLGVFLSFYVLTVLIACWENWR